MGLLDRFKSRTEPGGTPAFAPFFANYRITTRGEGGRWPHDVQPGWTELLGEYGGTTFDNGLYRLHTPSTAARANEFITAAHPHLAGKVEAFGYDWLGRIFALVPARSIEE